MSPSAVAIDILLAFAAAAVVARILHAIVHRNVRALEATAERRAALQQGARRLVRLITVLAFGAAGLFALALLLNQVGLESPLGAPRELAERLATNGVRILIIIVGSLIVVRAAHLAIDYLQHSLGRRGAENDLEWQRRASTLSGILTRIVTILVSFVALLMLLAELNVNVLPLLTSAGILGLAVGFGAQNLVRDVISGFFLILEDQVRIGDTARINNVTGTIEHINLRTIVLRDGDGAVHVFPNGTITALANLSKHFSYAVAEIRVRCSADIDRVLQTLRRVGEAMAADERWSAQVLEPLEIVGVESLTELSAVVKVRFKTHPLIHGAVANELRRRIMVALAAEKIRPFGS